MTWWLRCIVVLFAFGLPLGPALAAPLVLGQAEVARAAGGDGEPLEWTPVSLPHDWADTFPGYSGIVWYRLKLDLPARSSEESGLLGVYLQRACTNAQIYLNGEQIGGSGLMTGRVTRNCYYPQLASIPRAVLRPGANELRIRLAGFAANEVSARQRAAGLSPVRVGTLDELQPEYGSQLFWNVTVAQIIAATVGALGLAMLALAAARRRESYLLYFGLFTSGWALISTRLFVQDVPISHLATEILICSVFPPVLACAYLFLLRFIEQRLRWMDWLLVVQALAVPVVLWLASPGHLLRAASTVYNLLAVEFLVCLAFFFVTAWRAYRREFWLLGGVLVVAALLAATEIALQNDWLPLPKVHFIHFAMPFLFVVIGIRLIHMFVRALNSAETANQVLEQRVAEKSAEITRNYEQLTVLRAAQAAQDERQRIASDLHDDLGAKLLSIAQASQKAPQGERVAGLARQALDEMRLSVRGLTEDGALAADVLADWRAETVTRLADAGITAHWQADEPPHGLGLPARTHVQLTRVLREAVSNVIRHSGASVCTVRLEFAAGALRLQVLDNGRGLARRTAGHGHGLVGMEQRVRKLGGQHQLGDAPGGGTRLWVEVPLAEQSANIGSP